ncbi:MAG UNVERIFIED_CONTAM: hypothetical protein LVR18_34155 [Planctomycetaceae bacterium]
MRHANASFYDDASSQVRACSLKFADSDFASPLDLVMNTGVMQAFWHFRSFMAFVDARVRAREDRWDSQREWLRRWPGCFVGIIESCAMAAVFVGGDALSHIDRVSLPSDGWATVLGEVPSCPAGTGAGIRSAVSPAAAAAMGSVPGVGGGSSAELSGRGVSATAQVRTDRLHPPDPAQRIR